MQEEAIFPIVGYSYLEYSKSLEKDDIYLSNLYLTYALEMSDISIYFESGQGLKINEYLFYLMSDIGIRDIYFLGLGLLIGALSISAIVRLKKRKVTQKRHGLLKVRD